MIVLGLLKITKMKNQVSKIATLLFVTLFFYGKAQAQLPTLLQSKLQDTLLAVGNQYKFKGLSVAVSYKNAGIWKSAYGQSTSTQPLNTNMLIGIGSNTKTFVSALMIKLHENGQLHLDDTIGTWIQGYQNIAGNITIRQLLNHTSGVYSFTEHSDFWTALNNNLSKVWTKQEILTSFVDAPYFTSGNGFEYSNSNHLLAALIAESVTGRSLHHLIRDSILTPNNLQHTFFPPYETATDPYANFWTNLDGVGAWDDMGNWSQSGAVIPKEVQSAANAAGGIVSTAEDNVKFWKALMMGQIITKNSLVHEMMDWQNGGSYGLYGLSIMRKRQLGRITFSHGGTWLGQINSNLADTNNQIYITVLSNQDSLQNSYTRKVVEALYKVCLDFNQAVSVRNYVEDRDLKVYPNPATQVVYIKSTNGQSLKEAILFDQTGKIVLHKKDMESLHKNELDLRALHQGVYFLRMITQNGTIVNDRIVKK